MSRVCGTHKALGSPGRRRSDVRRTDRSAPHRVAQGAVEETADAVERQLRTPQGSVSTAECSELLGISRLSARRYLEHFAATGAVSVALRYGSAGRPERRYTWTSGAGS